MILLWFWCNLCSLKLSVLLPFWFVGKITCWMLIIYFSSHDTHCFRVLMHLFFSLSFLIILMQVWLIPLLWYHNQDHYSHISPMTLFLFFLSQCCTQLRIPSELFSEYYPLKLVWMHLCFPYAKVAGNTCISSLEEISWCWLWSECN